ncbi:MAG: hypothetical protein IJO47_01355 [Clostridia bacterium]|nr:hypothetical protein [Clostridia bacterium]
MANITQSERDKNWEEYLKKRSSSSKKKVIKMDWGDEDKQTQKTDSVSVPASAPVQERKTVGELRTAAMERQNKRAAGDKSAFERAGNALSSMGKKTLASVGILAKGTADSIVDSAKNRNNEKYQKAKDRRAVLEGRLADSAYDFNVDEGIEAPGGEAVTKQAIIRAGIEKAKEEEEKHKSKSVIPEEHWAMKLYESGEKDEEKAMEGLSENAKKLFGVGISIADTALTLPTAAISPSLPGTIMATKAAAGKTYELSKQGVSSGEALARGLVSGGIEYVTEKLPIDNIIDAVKIGGKPLVKSVLKQMGTEASEESVSYVLNHIADKAAQDPNAEFSFEELAASALGGAVSGGVFGAGANVIGNIGKSADVDVNIPKVVENKAETPANNSDIEPDTVDFSDEMMSPNDNVREMYRNKKALETQAQEIEANTVLSENEQRYVQGLLDGTMRPAEVPRGANIDNVMAVYRAKKAVLDNDAEIGKHNSRIAAERTQKAVDALVNVNTWKDKSMGVLYQRETMERNFRDIIPDKAEADRIIAEYITPVHKNEANSNRLKNTMRKVIKDLELSDKKNYYVEYMNGEDAMTGPVSESSLVQLLGEGKITDADVVKSGADLQKIRGAVDTFRSVYNGLIDQMNEVLIANGYPPVDYRKDYFPHFETEQPDSLFTKAAAVLGFDLQKDNLPTDIAGRTHEFRPGKSWFRNALRRTGVRTEYDAVKGFDRYIEGISNVINHTEDIRNIRALEDELRYETTDEATRKKVDEIRARDDIDELEKRRLMEEAYENGLDRTQMSNLAVELRRYGDNLANKKAVGDRDMEQKVGRIFYDLTKKVQGRVSSNMVAVNPSSWITNIIPITQGMSQLSHGDAVTAMGQALRNSVKDDGFADRSTFLTNRRGSDFLVKKKIEKAGDIAASPMYYIDDFVANALVRGKYNENIRNGMDEMSAMDNADAFAASIMADRSKGALPSIFDEKNPVTKLFTTFQVEVNNQLSYVLKDLPRMAQDEKKNLVWGLTKMFVYGFLYNQIYEYFIGRRPALDPVDMAFNFVSDVADTETPFIDDITNLGKSAAEQMPFIGGVLGGGRLPISSALPDVGNVATALDSSVAPEKRKEMALKEGGKVAAYFLMPFGGGQLKKTLEGVSAYAQEGSYTYDNEGNKKLKFPVEQTKGNAVKGALFGQYAYDTAQDYVEGGFKVYSASDTELIDSAEENGFTREEIIGIVDATIGMKADEKRQYIFELPMTGADKQKVYRMLSDGKTNIDFTDENSFKISSYFSSEDKRKYAKKAVDMGVDIEKVIKCFDEQKGEEGVEFQGKTVPNSRRKAVERVVMKYAKNEAQFIALMRLAGFTSYDSESYKMRKVPS